MQIAPREKYVWTLRTRALALGGRTLVMGILNVTPDSFSDGGRHVTLDLALQHALDMLDNGADILDVGGESTRPGTGAGTGGAISAEEEQARVLPIIKALRQERPEAILSVDTYRAFTAKLAVEAGAEIVNDVSGMLWDNAMASTCADLRCGVVAMHTRGLPSEWNTLPRMAAEQVLPTVLGGLREAVLRLMLAGCERPRIVLDPGFGFGKANEENWTLLQDLDRLQPLGFPLMAGLSRKGFLAQALQGILPETLDDQHLRDGASAGANVAAALAGAHILRVHDVLRTRVAVGVADALRTAAAVSGVS